MGDCKNWLRKATNSTNATDEVIGPPQQYDTDPTFVSALFGAASVQQIAAYTGMDAGGYKVAYENSLRSGTDPASGKTTAELQTWCDNAIDPLSQALSTWAGMSGNSDVANQIVSCLELPAMNESAVGMQELIGDAVTSLTVANSIYAWNQADANLHSPDPTQPIPRNDNPSDSNPANLSSGTADPCRQFAGPLASAESGWAFGYNSQGGKQWLADTEISSAVRDIGDSAASDPTDTRFVVPLP
ncbi:MAG: hypothetical protein FWF75_08595 [Propionibacteriaceae bacterium]|nr:hypothetical protein [Propionibacteriaceae bacterium]